MPRPSDRSAAPGRARRCVEPAACAGSAQRPGCSTNRTRARPLRLVVPRRSWTGTPRSTPLDGERRAVIRRRPATAAATEYDSRSLAAGGRRGLARDLPGERCAAPRDRSPRRRVRHASTADRRPQTALTGAVPTYAIANRAYREPQMAHRPATVSRASMDSSSLRRRQTLAPNQVKLNHDLRHTGDAALTISYWSSRRLNRT